MKLVNLTNKIQVVLDNEDCEVLRLPIGGVVCTASILSEVKERIQVDEGGPAIEVVATKYANVSGLPPPVPGTVYIVSYAVLKALEGTRPDVVAPDTSPSGVVRDGTGKVVGVRRFCKL